MSALRAQLRAELQLVSRNGEQLLLTLGIPVLLLVFFGLVDVLPTDTDKPAQFLLPGILALAVMSSAMVSLGIATGFERSYQVLKRLGATPLGRSRLILAKIISVFCVEVVQMIVLLPIGLMLGWRPANATWLLAILVVLLGTSAFAGIGLTMAGTLRGEINLAAQNGLYLVLLLLGGIIVPMDKLPTPLRAVGHALPSGALADVMREALTGTSSMLGTSPVVAGLAFNLVVMITHIPKLVNLSASKGPLHYSLHILLVTTALMFWSPVCGPLREWQLKPGGKMIYMFVLSFVPTIPAGWLTFATGSVYRHYDTPIRVWGISVLGDQQAAGGIMKLGGSVFIWAIIVFLFFKRFIGNFHEQQSYLHDDNIPDSEIVGTEEPLLYEDVTRAFAQVRPPIEE